MWPWSWRRSRAGLLATRKFIGEGQVITTADVPEILASA
jgi:hypothetical protein